MKHIWFTFLWVVPAFLAGGSLSHAQSPSENGRPEAAAVRVPSGSIRVDGRLDEERWAAVPPITSFVQKEPVEGAPPTDAMEVRFAYDDDALYVGARMRSSGPIQAPMGRRDSGNQAEHIMVSLDTYLDRRTAFSFGVTASGVRLDEYYARDAQWAADDGFDPVWDAQTTIDADGWNAEFRIPFSQIRFNDRPAQVWGLNIQRWIPTRNEEVFWALIPRTEQRFVSLFGELHGIAGIEPARRLELMPYVASSSHLVGDRDADDPFTSGGNLAGRVGLDAKVGIGTNLTLEATVNPDFGQVEADPAEVNLSAFETFFQERRPFFVEGSDLLTGTVNSYFYSRRIGAAPAGRASGDFVDFPQTSTILGAAKLTGRLEGGTSIGFLGAVTAGETARFFNRPSLFGEVRVAPSTTYGVARMQQEFGAEGSTVGLMATAVHRALEAADPLARLLPRSAFTVSGDSVLRFRDGDYEIGMNAGMSVVQGEADAITRLQRSSARYFQRPDVDYVTFDPLRTSMTGAKAGFSIERENTEHWLWEVSAGLESPEFETNDLGRLTGADGLEASAEIEYRETVPGRWFREYAFGFSQDHEWNYAGVRQVGSAETGFAVTWPNFWATEVSGSFDMRTQDLRLTRGGPSMQRPRGWSTEIEVESSSTSRIRGDASMAYGRTEDGGLEVSMGTGVTLQPGSRWQLTISPEYEREVDTQQYVSTLGGGRDATFGSRYVFARIDRSTYSTQFRLNYTFQPDLTLEFYGEPFAASGRYGSFGELLAARSRALRLYGTDGTTVAIQEDGERLVTDGAERFMLDNEDFNVRSFRSNLVLRWEYRPGSTLYLVWQQDREAEELVGARASLADMFSSVGTRGDNFFAVKASFWFSPN